MTKKTDKQDKKGISFACDATEYAVIARAAQVCSVSMAEIARTGAVKEAAQMLQTRRINPHGIKG
jgi:hypothetical protein